MGHLEVISGCMFSGKSEELLRRLRRSEIAGKNVVLIKPEIDTRYEENYVTSHGGSKMPCVMAKNARDVLEVSDHFDVVGIDEVQFFNSAIVGSILYICRDRVVIASGLDTNYRYEPFGVMPDLMALADTVDKLTAICTICGEEATKTQRLIDGEPASLSGPEILVGGTDSYEARCNKHFQIK
jgi:thymidine kinase